MTIYVELKGGADQKRNIPESFTPTMVKIIKDHYIREDMARSFGVDLEEGMAELDTECEQDWIRFNEQAEEEYNEIWAELMAFGDDEVPLAELLANE